ncbi:MAG: amidohydrolase family protein [bacterium]|nr:amidohydrolase family protein [bacterium]MCP5069101.1 amidohydrolase family protein [bacterium]
MSEKIIDPGRPIVDPHHHLWHSHGGIAAYLLEDLWADTGSGHFVEKTVFVECGASYREAGPEHMKPVGETEFVAEIAAASAEGGGNSTIAGIVSRADLRLGEGLLEVLDAHEEAGRGLFRGIRHAGAHALHPEVLMIPGSAPEGLFSDPDFRRGVGVLGRRGLTYDTWHYHYQNSEFLELARAVPETTLILDHFGTPLGVGPYADHREAIFESWKGDIAALAGCPNVVAKLGGLAMPDNGFGWHERDTPPDSDEFAEAQRRYYLHAIDCFGPDRCMFESNFPVDRLSLPYAVLYNGLKKIATGFSEDEQNAMFYGTAARVYRL